MDKMMFIGNLTADPETRTTPTGKSVCNFSVAVNKTIAGQKTTKYYRCAAWNKTGELCHTYLKKGSKVYVEGELQPIRAYVDKNGQPAANIEVMVNSVEFLSPSGQGSAAAAAPQNFTAVENDEIPF